MCADRTARRPPREWGLGSERDARVVVCADTQLAGSGGDEEWRALSAGRKVRVVENGKGGAKCAVLAAAWGGKRCAADELALVPLPSRWSLGLNALAFGMSWNSLPVAREGGLGGELHCCS